MEGVRNLSKVLFDDRIQQDEKASVRSVIS